MPNPRLVYALGFAICAALLGFALYLQHGLGEDPCPLCIFQRVAVAALGVVFLTATLHNPRRAGMIAYGALILLVAGVGAGISARHVYLQQLPAGEIPECGPGLSYILEAFPLSQALRMVLEGSGECAQAGWRFLGVTIPGWTLLFFLLLGIVGLVQIWNRQR